MHRTATRRSLRFCFCLLLTASFARVSAQNQPICFQLFFPVVQASVGDTVCIPLMVRSFDQIASVQLAVHWDSLALSLVGVDYIGSALPDIGPLNSNQFAAGELRFSWNAAALMGVSLPDSAVIINLCFRVNNTASGFLPLKIGSSVSYFYYEVVQMLPPDWHVVYMPLAQQIGGISVDGVGGSDLAVTTSCAAGTICNAPTGIASVTVTGGVPPYNYYWTGPNGFTATTASLLGIFGGDYQVTVTDQAAGTVAAEIKVNDDKPTIWVTTQSTEATCGLANGCATLTVFGGLPPFTYEWSEGSSQTGQNCALPPGEHSVTVTDSRGCFGTKSVVIGNTNGFNFNLSREDITECGGTGSLTAYPPATPAPFQYLWSNGDTTKTTSGLEEGLYTVTITNGAGCTSSKGPIKITNSITYGWNIIPSATCNDPVPNTSKIKLKYNPDGLLIFPCTITWSNGTTHTLLEKPAGTILDSMLNLPSGNYYITVSDAAGCSIVVNSRFDCTQFPPVPDNLPAFYIKDEYLNAQYAVDSCTGVYARNFNDMQSLSFSLYWEDADFANVRKLNLPGASYSDFTFDGYHTLGFDWQSQNPVSLAPESLLFEVCFTPYTNPYPSTRVRFTDTPVDIQLKNGQGQELAFIGMEGYVIFGLYFPLQPSICDFGVLPPSCAANGNSQVILGQCNPGLSLKATLGTKNFSQTIGNTSSMLSIPAGKYSATAIQAASLQNYFFVKIPPPEDSTECVWPGDADNNNAANHYDLLYIGMAYGKQGLTRNNASLDWIGQDATDWADATSVRHVNFKNIDTNGDGVVNAADTVAIVQNWNRVINATFDDPYGAPSNGQNAPAYPLLSINADTLLAGQSVLLPLLLGSATMPLDSVYGLAFSIAYDPDAVKDNVRFIPSNSWFGDSSEYLILQKNFPQHGHIDIAITRTDGVPVSGWGAIGNLFIIIEDNIFGDPAPLGNPDTTLKSLLYFNGIRSINAIEKPKPLDAPPVELVIQRQTSATHYIHNWARGIQLYPNPATDMLYISSPEARIVQVELMDMAGRIFSSIRSESTDFRLPLGEYNAGFYFVRIETAKGTTTRKLNILR